MKNSTRGQIAKFIFTFCLIVLGLLTAFRELYLTKQDFFISGQSQVLAASAIEPLNNSFPTPKKPLSETATVSATLVQGSNFEVNLPVLMYHHIRETLLVTDRSDIEFSVSPASLDKQFSYLHFEGYQTLGLNDLFDALENGTPLPPKSVILTFDDGFRDFYTHAFPLLKKYNMRAVMFYVAGYNSYPGYMDQQMLQEIHKSGLVDVQGHTMSHALLTSIRPEEVQREISESKTLMETTLNKKINYFAYPYGASNQNIISAVTTSGYRLAFGTTPGSLLRQSEKFALPRIAITGFDDLKRFQQKIGVTTQEFGNQKELTPVPDEIPSKEGTGSAQINNQ